MSLWKFTNIKLPPTKNSMILGSILKVELIGYSDIESGCGRRRVIKNKSEIVGLNNLKDGVDISYNWEAVCFVLMIG